MSEDLKQELYMAHRVVESQGKQIERLRAALREIEVTLAPDLQNECPRKAYMIAQEALGDE